MAYEEEFWQEIVRSLIFLSILSAVMRRQNQQQSAAKTRKKPQEHDERFPWRIVSEMIVSDKYILVKCVQKKIVSSIYMNSGRHDDKKPM